MIAFFSLGPNCPREIYKLAEKCKVNSSQRSYLFEHWLLADGCWAKSKLLLTLRSKKANKKRGLRRWYTRAELEERYGQSVAADIIEAKEMDDYKREHEIRPHPECPQRKDR